MKTLLRSLQDYPPAMLRAIAEVDGLAVTSNVARLMVEQLASLLGDPARLQMVVAACSPSARAALDELLGVSGRSLRVPFERRHGAIRAMGPGRIERERPYLAFANPTEELWYRGLIYSAFAETPDGLVEFLYVPADLAALLPAPEPAPAVLHALVCQPPQIVEPANDLLLHDICTLLCLVQTGDVRLVDGDDPTSWQRTSLYELRQFSLHPAGGDEELPAEPGLAAALALALAGDLGWLQPRGRRKAGLRAAAVRAWLEAPRCEQRRTVLNAWRASQTWNDLCRTPGLTCEDTGNWRNDPVATRERLLPLLAQLSPHAWYELEVLVDAIKKTAPDFQRPDGVYDTWYIRERHSQAYLRGFDFWNAVEGAVVRFLVAGPLHWLGVFDLGRASRLEPLDDVTPADAPTPAPHRWLSPTAAGQAWLASQPAPSGPDSEATLTVLADYTVVVPSDAPLLDRFRVSRFTTWEPPTGAHSGSALTFRYRITQSGLRRAAAQGIDAERVLAFLQERSARPLPAAVIAGLQRW